MTRINLYPWREELIVKQKKNYIILLVSSSICVFLMMLILNMFYSRQIDKQTENNAYINNQVIQTQKKLREISVLKANRQATLARINVLQQLDQDRYSTIHLFNQVIELINPLVVLDTITREDKTIRVSGYAESNTGVAQFLRAIELSNDFHSAELDQIKVNINKDKYLSQKGLQHYFELKFFHENELEQSEEKEPHA